MVELNATILAQIISFFILLFILKRILFEPLIKIIEERRAYISESESKIRERLLKLEESEKIYENQLIEAKKSAQEIINKNISIAEEEKQNIINEVVAQTKKEFGEFLKELEEHKSMLKKELEQEIGFIAQSVTDKVLTTDISVKESLNLSKEN